MCVWASPNPSWLYFQLLILHDFQVISASIPRHTHGAMESWTHLCMADIRPPHPQRQGCFLRHWGKKGNVRMWRKSGRACKTVECKITFPTESGTSETQASFRWCGSTERFPEQACKSQVCFYQHQTKTWQLSTSKAILPQLWPFALKVSLVGKAYWLLILACPSLLLIKKPYSCTSDHLLCSCPSGWRTSHFVIVN